MNLGNRSKRNRRIVNRATYSLLESLEGRRLLAADCPDQPTEKPPQTPPPDPCDCAGNQGTGSSNSGTGSGAQPSGQSTNPIRYVDGTPVVQVTDLASSGFGNNWGWTRSWTGLNNSGQVGNGWMVTQSPYLIVWSTFNTLAVDDYKPIVAAIDAGGSQRIFELALDETGTTDSRFFTQDKLERLGSSGNFEWRLTDSAGNITYYYDLPRDGAGKLTAKGANSSNSSFFGKIKKFIDNNGTETRYDYDGSGQLTAMTRFFGTVAEKFAITYSTVSNALGASASLIATVTLKRSSDYTYNSGTGAETGTFATIRSVAYDYYTGATTGNDASQGRIGDLKLVTVRDSAGATIDQTYYRYNKFWGTQQQSSTDVSRGPTNDPSTTGGTDSTFTRNTGNIYNNAGSLIQPADLQVSSGLKAVVSGASLDRLRATYSDISAATDSQIKPFVNDFYVYERWADRQWNYTNYNNGDFASGYHLYTRYRVVEEFSQGNGCSACSGGQGVFRFEYETSQNTISGSANTNTELNANVWLYKVTEFFPDRTNTDPTRTLSSGDMTSESISGEAFATIQWPSHGFLVGETIVVSGANEAQFNGRFKITSVTANAFKVRILRHLTSQATATGTITVTNFSATSRDNDRRIVYLNETGQVMLKAEVDAKGTTSTSDDQKFAEYYRYKSQNSGTSSQSYLNGAGQVLLHALPSAVTGWDESWNGLVTSNLSLSNAYYEYIKSTGGVLEVYDYFDGESDDNAVAAAGETTAGRVEGYLKEIRIKNGKADGTSPLAGGRKQERYTYYRHVSNGTPITPIASTTVYANDNGTGAQITSFEYTWDGVQIASIKTLRDGIELSQNGRNSYDIDWQVMDDFGRVAWTKDADGFINHFEYDLGTGALTKVILDVDTTLVTGAPWSTPTGGGLHLETTFEVDGLGRTTKQTDADGRVTRMVYKDADHEVRIYRGFSAGTTTGPIEVVREYRPAVNSGGDVYRESLTTSATPTLDGSGNPTGAETIDASNIQSLVRSITNAGDQVVELDAYYSMAGVTYSPAATHLGTASDNSATGNYHATLFGYDQRGRMSRTVSANGTVYKTEFDGRSLPISQWIGTNDEFIAGTDDMVQVSLSEYDDPDDSLPSGGIGDGNLTKLVQFPSGAGVTSNARIVRMFYDWRNRLVLVQSPALDSGSQASSLKHVSYFEYDNLGNTLFAEEYDGVGSTVADSSPADGVPDRPSGSALRSKTQMQYDDQSRLFRSSRFSVNPTTGAVSSSALVSNLWYDARGNLIKQTTPGSASTKLMFDGAGRLLKSFTTNASGDASSGNTWNDAITLTGDTVLEQVDYGYDKAGDITLLTTRRRFHDTVNPSSSNSSDFELGNATSSTQPKARVSYTAYFYDAGRRTTATVDVGTNYDSVANDFTKYENLTSVLPSRADDALVTSFLYDAGGRLQDVTNPRGITSRTTYDLLSRATRVTEAYVNGTAETTDGREDDDRITDYTFDGVGRIRTQKAVLPGTSQETKYIYDTAQTSGSVIHSKDLLAAIFYPDTATGSASSGQDERITVNALGERVTWTDRNDTTHTYARDLLGRVISDTATFASGSTIDQDIERLGYTFESRGLSERYTSYRNANGTDVANEVLRQYNGLGQLTAEYQNHSGAITSGNISFVPKVGYAYSEMSGGNHSRLTSMTYPNGRVLNFNYASGTDTSISRLSSISDSSATLESYTYLGVGSVVTRSHSETGIDLSFIKLSAETNGSAGDQYTGLDRFGRIEDQRWLSSTSDVDRFAYTYDRNGNRTRKNVVTPGAPTTGSDQIDEYYAYDKLDRLVEARRGTFASGGITMPSVTWLAAWDLDALGNVSNYLYVNDPQAGDTNFDGNVDFADLLVVAQNYNGGDGIWRQGDFNADGSTNFDDLLAQAQVYDTSGYSTSIEQLREYDAQNRLTKIDLNNDGDFLDANEVLSYDTNGSIVGDQHGRTLIFDAWDRLKAVKDGSTTLADYASDALGRRIVEGPVASPTHNYHSASWQVVEERDSSGVTRTQYVWSAVYVDALIERDRDTDANGSLDERLYYLQDANFNVTAVVGDTETGTAGVQWGVIERYRYQPYGDRTVLNVDFSVRTGGTANAVVHAIQGGKLDAVTGRVHFRNRDLDVELMRWTQQDQARYIDGMNRYSGLQANPTSLVDPSGLNTFNIVLHIDATTKPADLNMNQLNQMAGALATQINAGLTTDSVRISFVTAYQKPELGFKYNMPGGSMNTGFWDWVPVVNLCRFTYRAIKKRPQQYDHWIEFPTGAGLGYGQTGGQSSNVRPDAIKNYKSGLSPAEKSTFNMNTAYGNIAIHEAIWHGLLGKTFHDGDVGDLGNTTAVSDPNSPMSIPQNQLNNIKSVCELN